MTKVCNKTVNVSCTGRVPSGKQVQEQPRTYGRIGQFMIQNNKLGVACYFKISIRLRNLRLISSSDYFLPVLWNSTTILQLKTTGYEKNSSLCSAHCIFFYIIAGATRA